MKRNIIDVFHNEVDSMVDLLRDSVSEKKWNKLREVITGLDHGARKVFVEKKLATLNLRSRQIEKIIKKRKLPVKKNRNRDNTSYWDWLPNELQDYILELARHYHHQEVLRALRDWTIVQVLGPQTSHKHTKKVTRKFAQEEIDAGVNFRTGHTITKYLTKGEAVKATMWEKGIPGDSDYAGLLKRDKLGLYCFTEEYVPSYTSASGCHHIVPKGLGAKTAYHRAQVEHYEHLSKDDQALWRSYKIVISTPYEMTLKCSLNKSM